MSSLTTQQKHIQNLYNSEKFSDYTIHVDGTVFYCHKNILASIPYFDSIFSSNFSDSHTKLYAVDSTAAAYEVVLKTIYGCEIDYNVFSDNDLKSLIKLSDMLIMTTLKMSIIDIVIKKFDFSDYPIIFTDLMPFVKSIHTYISQYIQKNKSVIRDARKFSKLIKWIDISLYPTENKDEFDKYPEFYYAIEKRSGSVLDFFKNPRIDKYCRKMITNSFNDLSKSMQSNINRMIMSNNKACLLSRIK